MSAKGERCGVTLLPDTMKRMDDLPPDPITMWNETGFLCPCGNTQLIASKRRLYCNKCERYWEKGEIDGGS